jgi:hypothetical protein
MRIYLIAIKRCRDGDDPPTHANLLIVDCQSLHAGFVNQVNFMSLVSHTVDVPVCPICFASFHPPLVGQLGQTKVITHLSAPVKRCPRRRKNYRIASVPSDPSLSLILLYCMCMCHSVVTYLSPISQQPIQSTIDNRQSTIDYVTHHL